MANSYDFDWGIKTLRNHGIDIPDCLSVDEFYHQLELLLPKYASQPGKLYHIYGEMRMITIKVYESSGTEFTKKMCLAHAANRFLMNLAVLKRHKEGNDRNNLYQRVFEIEVISAPKSHHIHCSNCAFLDGKKYRIIEDFMGGYEHNNDGQTVNFTLPMELSNAMDKCTDNIGCILSLG